MVTPNGHAKILDLGLALAVDEELPADKTIVGGQGYVVGSMDYIAPEQVDDPTQVDARADLYSLGCTLYFALTGQPPFPGGTSVEKMKRHRTKYAGPDLGLQPDRAGRVRPRRRTADGEEPSRGATRRPRPLATPCVPWAAGEPETPLDVDPDQTEAEVVLELERSLKGPRAVLRKRAGGRLRGQGPEVQSTMPRRR